MVEKDCKMCIRDSYYFDPDMASFEKLIGMLQSAVELTGALHNINTESE